MFNDFDRSKFDCLVQKATAAGVAIQGDQGEVSKDGITIRWSFDPQTRVLTLQCTDSPFFLPCGTINSKIHDLVDSCR